MISTERPIGAKVVHLEASGYTPSHALLHQGCTEASAPKQTGGPVNAEQDIEKEYSELNELRAQPDCEAGQTGRKEYSPAPKPSVLDQEEPIEDNEHRTYATLALLCSSAVLQVIPEQILDSGCLMWVYRIDFECMFEACHFAGRLQDLRQE